MPEAGVMAEPTYRDTRAQNLAKAREAKAAKRNAAPAEPTVPMPTPELPPGHVMARVLKNGHGKIHTGALTDTGGAITPPKIDDTEFLALKGEDWRKAYDAAFAQAASEVGMTYTKGAVIQLPQKSAERYEERGWVEIVDGS